MATVYIGIGSNLGDRQKNCLRAIELLQKRGIVVTKQSSLYETEPWGYKDQPQFINMAIEIETEFNPKELLMVLKNIEREIGREESLRWGPRKVDLDILLFDTIILTDILTDILTEDSLEIPHPLLHKRDFVLKPLCEIASDIHHPLLKMSIGNLLQQLYKKSQHTT